MKKLTDSLEDELLAQIELRGSLTDKKLCERYDISRVGLWKAVQRAKQRRAEQAIGGQVNKMLTVS